MQCFYADLHDIYKVVSTALRYLFKENGKEVYVLETRYVPVSVLKPKLFEVVPVSLGERRDKNSHWITTTSIHIP